jgi:DNA mismatch repair protein MutS
VARLAGIPEPVITRAREILGNMEKEELDPGGRPRISRKRNEKKKPHDDPMQPDLFGYKTEGLVNELGQTDPDHLTPLEALNLLSEWKKRYL